MADQRFECAKPLPYSYEELEELWKHRYPREDDPPNPFAFMDARRPPPGKLESDAAVCRAIRFCP